jgi:N-acetyl-gamma-glutamyl-phosphate reductase
MRTVTSLAVLGASGFTGGELVRLLLGHPSAELVFAGGDRSAGRALGEIHPHLSRAAARIVLEEHDPDAVAARAEFALLALPSGASAAIAPTLLDAGVRVVDLAGDHRLPAAAYPSWYGFEHPEPARLDGAVYGIPELAATQIAGADLVANPGCYPTAAVLALVPLIRAGLVDASSVVVDGKTGWSGAGRTATEEASFARADGSVRPYGSPGHRHTPEIEVAIGRATGVMPGVTFVPHLVPSTRGVLVTCYLALAGTASTEDLTRALLETYAGSPFVAVLGSGELPDTKRTHGSNVVEVAAFADPRTRRAVAVAALDNLMKGAAGQAVQNLNLMLGLDETTGLPLAGWYP